MVLLALLALAGVATTHPAVPAKPIPEPAAQVIAPPAASMARPSAARPAPLAGSWEEVGPTNQAGPTWCASLDLSGTSLYIGVDWAGFFSGDPLSPFAWTPRADNLGFGAHRLVVTPTDTGERWLAASRYGPMAYSTDGGGTWQTPTGLPANCDNIKRLVRDPRSAEGVYMLAHGDVDYGGGPETGWHVMLSNDGGQSWTGQYLEGDGQEPDLWVPRMGLTSPAIYLISQGDLLVSANQGLTWDDHGALPASGNALLAGSEAGAPHLYAMVDNTIFASPDLGASWSAMQDVSADVPLALCAAPDDSMLVLWGNFHAYHSEDGGATVTTFPHEWLFDDTHIHEWVQGIDCFQIQNAPSSAHGTAGARPPGRTLSYQRRFYIHTLGGTWAWDPSIVDPLDMTRDNFPNTEVWATVTSQADPTKIELGSRGRGEIESLTIGPDTPLPLGGYIHVIGPQDVGNVGSSTPDVSTLWMDFGSEWCVVGPFFECQARPSDFSPVQFGPFAIDPNDPLAVFWGGAALWKVTRVAPNTYQQSALHVFDDNDAPGDVVTAFLVAPGPGNLMYVGTRLGRHFVSRDFGHTWTQGSGVADPFVSSYSGMGITAEPGDSTRVWMGGSHGKLWFTTDRGVHWFMDDIGVDTNVWGLAFDNAVDRHLYAATDAGPYMKGPGGWVPLSGAPRVPFYRAESLPHAGRVRFATFGRGIWDYVTGSVTAVTQDAPPTHLLLAVHPNPLRGAGSVDFAVPASGEVRVDLFDVAGRRVRRLLDAERPAGSGAVSFDGRSDSGRPLATGLYLVQVSTASETQSQRFMLIH